ncbi:MAG: hypothetical protein H0V47_05510, partial [Chloroflexia bacterium]|nr:hypothetical protein [Chloroflexia bacterium]
MIQIHHISPLAVLLFSLTTFTVIFVFALARASASTVVAADTFSRNAVDNWRPAETGGSYLLTGGAANFDVADGVGTMRVPKAGVTRTATLPSVSVQNVDLRVRVQTDKDATGGGLDVDLIARRIAANTEYRFRAHISADGSISVRIVRAVSGQTVQLGRSGTVQGPTHTAGRALWIRAQATDVNPTTLRMKIWEDGQSEPDAWTYGASDNTQSLQALGAVGLRAFVSSTSNNAPVTFAFDELEARSLPALDVPVLIGAGDIASCTSSGDQATASLLDGMRGTVFTMGDNAYPRG